RFPECPETHQNHPEPPIFHSNIRNVGSFLDLVRSNEDMGNDYIENDFIPPTTEEIRNARLLATVLPDDIGSHATLIAAALCADSEGGDPESRSSLSGTSP